MSYNSYSNSLGRRPSREHCATSGPGKELPGQRGSGGSQSSRGSTYPGSSFQSGAVLTHQHHIHTHIHIQLGPLSLLYGMYELLASLPEQLHGELPLLHQLLLVRQAEQRVQQRCDLHQHPHTFQRHGCQHLQLQQVGEGQPNCQPCQPAAHQLVREDPLEPPVLTLDNNLTGVDVS